MASSEGLVSIHWRHLYYDLSVSFGRLLIRLKLLRLVLVVTLVMLVVIVLHRLYGNHGNSFPPPSDSHVRSLDGPHMFDTDNTLQDALDSDIADRDTLADPADTGEDQSQGSVNGLNPVRVFPPMAVEDSPQIQAMKAALMDLNNPATSQSEPNLVQLIRDFWIEPPSKEEYQLKDPWQRDFSMGQSEIVDSLLQGMEGGFFVEVGALDGETRSNTLFFERERKWTGLLMEVGPVNYRQLISKHRRAYTTPACISVKPYPNVMQFNRGRNRGRLIDGPSALDFVQNNHLAVLLVEVQCFPLYSLMLALNQTTVHYFSLDVEGVELDVLRTIPFHLVDIRVITVEFKHNSEGKSVIREHMESQGYVLVTEITREDGLANDFVFQKR